MAKVATPVHYGPELRDVALEIFKFTTVHRRNRPVEVNVREAFYEAKVFLDFDATIANGTRTIEDHRAIVVAPVVTVDIWDNSTNSPFQDDFGKVVTHEVKADVHAYASGLPDIHPINQGYIKGRLMLGLPINDRFKEAAEKCGRELGKKVILDKDVDLRKRELENQIVESASVN